jgi:hypothetical protein
LTDPERRLALSIPHPPRERHTQSVDASAGYSKTPQAAKLGLQPDATWDVVDAPDEWACEAPADPALRSDGDADVVLAFVTTAAGVRRAIEQLKRRIFRAGALWIAWPRKAAGHVSEENRG